MMLNYFFSQKWVYVKFSCDYVNFVENVIICITVALWESCYQTFSFVLIPEEGELLSYYSNRTRIFGMN